MISSEGLTQESTRRLAAKKQTLDDAYAIPANFLEIDVVNPITHGIARNRYTDYEVRMRVSDHWLADWHNRYLFITYTVIRVQWPQSWPSIGILVYINWMTIYWLSRSF